MEESLTALALLPGLFRPWACTPAAITASATATAHALDVLEKTHEKALINRNW
jgi:hypothetical protein